MQCDSTSSIGAYLCKCRREARWIPTSLYRPIPFIQNGRWTTKVPLYSMEKEKSLQPVWQTTTDLMSASFHCRYGMYVGMYVIPPFPHPPGGWRRPVFTALPSDPPLNDMITAGDIKQLAHRRVCIPTNLMRRGCGQLHGMGGNILRHFVCGIHVLCCPSSGGGFNFFFARSIEGSLSGLMGGWELLGRKRESTRAGFDWLSLFCFSFRRMTDRSVVMVLLVSC